MATYISQGMIDGLTDGMADLSLAIAGKATDADLTAAMDAMSDTVAQIMADALAVETGVDPTNGEWAKFSDGTLICRKSITLGATSTLAAPINATPAVSWTFPVPFVGVIPSISVSGSGHFYGTPSVTLTAGSVRAFFVSATTSSVTAHATAIGRWK